MSAQVVILFHTSNHAFRAEKLAAAQGIACRLVPVPRHLSSDCGVCLRLEAGTQDEVSALLSAARVEIAGVHGGCVVSRVSGVGNRASF